MAALLGELARSITASLDLDTILQTVAEGARELYRSDLAAIAGTVAADSPGAGRGPTFRVRLPLPDPVLPAPPERGDHP